MPSITQIIRAGSTDAPTETIRTLHTELAAVGLPVSGTETSGTPRFETATASRVKEFQKLHRLSETGDLDPVTGGVMSLSALVATEQDRGRLRTALRAAEGQVSDAPLYNYWLARYAVMNRDFGLARRLRDRLGDIVVDLDDLVVAPDFPVPQKPEVPFPENFYTYRYNLISQGDITTLRTGRTQFSAGVPSFMVRMLDPQIPDIEEPPEIELPPSTPLPPAEDQKARLANSAEAWLAAIEAWQQGNADFDKRRYAGAVANYTRCQQAALQYFAIYPDYNLSFSGDTLDAKIDDLVRQIASDRVRWAGIWEQINWRYQLLSLNELRTLDWTQIGPYSSVYLLLKANLTGKPQVEPPTHPLGPEHRTRLMDARLLVIAAVLVPLARGEANRLRRQYAAARHDFERVIRDTVPVPNSNPPAEIPASLKCEFIEPPFARLLLAETLFDQAESQYKSRLRVEDQANEAQRTADLAKINEIAQDFQTRNIPGHAGNATKPLQHLIAAVSYSDISGTLTHMDLDGAYVSRTKEALNVLSANIASTIVNAQPGSQAFRSMGQQLTLPTVAPLDSSLPKLIDSKHPHQPYLKIEGPGGQVVDERNPRVYAILLQAQARLLQIWSGFNYLGYSDDHVPTWRFMFLLERARYFTEHAKNAQREYLNFLSNAEREEFQELTASQNVELEKGNVRIETARVEQVMLEVESAKASEDFAQLTSDNAQLRADAYKDFDENADDASIVAGIGIGASALGAIAGGAIAGAVAAGPGGAAAGAVAGGVVSLFSGGGQAVAGIAQLYIADYQREYEKYSLDLAVSEASKSAIIAQHQLAVAQASLTVAGLQRAAALLRHEFAIQNLSFLRNRTLNAELWYRLSGAIRSVADTYLRYGIEMAFLAEQAYEFEADKRIDVIRFDYDVSDLGDMLAGDFLLRDLDTLEQDLIVGQKLRQQQVRYVLSLAREYPEALQELRDKGQMTFALRLEQLERRFPGLFNLRISSVEVLPFALMDATRFSLELTQLGSGQVRLKTQAGNPPATTPTDPSSPENTTNDWLVGIEADWAVRPRVMGPETAIFSGLSQQNLGGNASFFASNQRGAFEGLPGAGSWQVDLSMKENRIVPDTLADLLLIFTLSGYYDTGLRKAVDHAPRKPMASTAWFSAHRSFPDAYYQFNRAGRMDWSVTQEMLSLQGSLDHVQNVAVLCAPSQRRMELGRILCSYPIEFTVDAAGTVAVLREFPRFSLTTTGLTLNATLNTPPGSTVSFDFGDGTGLHASTAFPHTYARPGRYEVLARIAANGRLTEYRAVVVVSRQHAVLPPCIAFPTVQATVTGGKIKLQPSLQVPSGEQLSVSWRIDNQQADAGAPTTFTLDPGRYVLRFAAIRPLTARFYSQQRFNPTRLLTFKGLHLSTNRTFDVATGNETTTNLNAFGQHVFGPGPSAALSLPDRWTLELPLDDNPCLVSVSSSDTKQHDLGELSDVFLVLEYKVRDE